MNAKNMLPAIVSLLWPKNLGILTSYLQRVGPRTVITSRESLTEEHLAELRAHGAHTIAIEDVLSPSRATWLGEVQDKILGGLTELSQELVAREPLQLAAMNFTTVKAKEFLSYSLRAVAALDELAAECPIELVLLNEDWMIYSKSVFLWAKERGLPTLHLEHNPFIVYPYTAHDRQYSDHMAVFGEMSREVFSDAGFDISRLHLTGLPHFDPLIAEKDNRSLWRQRICEWHRLDTDRPIVVYGTTWRGSLSALEEPDYPMQLLKAYFSAIKRLGRDVQHIIKDRPGAGFDAEQVVRALGREIGVPDDAYVYISEPPTVKGITSEKPLPYLLGADLIVACDSGLLVEAICVGTRGVNLLTNTYFPYGPAFPGDCGIRQTDPGKLPETILATLADASIPRQMAEAAPRINAGQDGRATERFVQLMGQVALENPALLTYTPDAPLKFPPKPPVWKTMLAVESNDATAYHGTVRSGLVDLSARPIRVALDVGCAAGGTGRYIKQKYPGARVYGVEINQAAARLASQCLDKVMARRLEDVDFKAEGIAPGTIDTVILADVLEHLYDPWSALERLHPYLTTDAQLLISIPNVRNLKLMEDLAEGYWRYADHGLLDITHIRFFTLKEFRRCLFETGYHIGQLLYAIDPRLQTLYDKLQGQPGPHRVSAGRMVLENLDQEEIDELCSLQFNFVANAGSLAEDLERYERVTAHDHYLNSIAPSSLEALYFEQFLAEQPARPEILVLLFAGKGATERITATVSSLAAGLYNQVRIHVIADLAAPSIAEGGRFHWSQTDPDNPASALDIANRVAAQSDADWITWCFAGDEIASVAFLRMIELASRKPECHLIYCHEDAIDNTGHYHEPRFKPGPDPDLLYSRPYLGGLQLVQRTSFVQAGGFDPASLGAEEYDLDLRLLEAVGAQGFALLPETLYHRHPEGGHAQQLTSEIIKRCRQALEGHLERRGNPATVENGWQVGSFRVRYPVPADTLVSILLPVQDNLAALQKTVEGIFAHTATPSFELLILDCASTDPDLRTYLEGLEALDVEAIRIYQLPSPAPLPQLYNLLAREARGNVLVLQYFDAVPMADGWLADLVGHALQPDVGCVAPRQLDGDGKIRASAILPGVEGLGTDAFAGKTLQDPGPDYRAHQVGRFSALPGGCLVTRKEVFEAAGGLDWENLPATGAEADLTLRLAAAGLANVFTPYVSIYSQEQAGLQDWSKSESSQEDDGKAAREAVFYDRHLPLLARDPAYPPPYCLTNPPFLFEARVPLNRDILPWRPIPKLLVTYADRGGCGHYRILLPAEAMTQNNLAWIDATQARFLVPDIARIAPDSYVVQRQIMPEQIAELSRVKKHLKVPLIYELDDLITEVPVESPHHGQMPKDIAERLKEGVALADRFIVSTESMAEYYRGFNPDTLVVPNRLPKSLWQGFTPRRRAGPKPRVGWIGSISHMGDLVIIEEVVARLAKEVDWVFMGLCPDRFRPYVAELHPGVPFAAYPAKLASLNLDLALAPLAINNFNAAKSNLKLLEYGVLGYPVIATDHVPYRCNLPATLVKNSPIQWINAIREHLSDMDACAARGDELRAAVERDWMLEDHIQEWRDAWLGR